ncbi:MAG TPA: YbhB/YbcL family Raf kinase inhibitor-like protein [Terriglobia bacterium]|nr:YbhB/YbcL family Raf kinase inhibitor-like protein [Terriglobia bacterium]
MKKTTHHLIGIPAVTALAWSLAAAGPYYARASGPTAESRSSKSTVAGTEATANGAAGTATSGAPSMVEGASPAQQSSSPNLSLSTKAFKPGASIPKQFACDGLDASPDLDWSNAPQNTRSFVLIVEDPDAPGGTWVHWVVYDLPAGTHRLPEGVPKRSDIQAGGRQGGNDFGEIGYDGPCPPPGRPHRYFFRLFALDNFLNLKGRVTKAAVEQAMKGHVLEQGELMGRYERNDRQ